MGLLTGFAVPALAVLRLGLSAHIPGVLGGNLMMLGLPWSGLALSAAASGAGCGMSAYRARAGWLTPLLAGAWSASRRASWRLCS
jgi:(hydroxyamino)benzene mutase